MDSKRILTIGVLVMTLVLGGAALYFGYRLSQEGETVDPRDTTADDNNGDGYVDPFWNIGGWPDQSVINQYYECGLTENPCMANTGHDAYCICPGDAYPADIGCTDGVGAPPRSAPVNFTEKRQGQSLGCVPVCGDGRVSTGEQCDDGNTTNGDGCNNNCQTELTCYRCTAALNDGNECESQAATGTTCPTGWSTTAACETTATGGQCPGPVGCGDTCEATADCSTGLVCDTENDRCILAECEGNDECLENGCEVPTPECGDSCEEDSDCRSGHSCDPDSDKCVITQCLNNDNCTDNGCRLPLPETALFDKTSDRLLVGIMAIVIGLIALKFDYISGAKNLWYGLEQYKVDSHENKIRKQREKFEEKVASKE